MKIGFYIISILLAFNVTVFAENDINSNIENIYNDVAIDNTDITIDEDVHTEPQKFVVYAVESELMYNGKEVINTWSRPFVYDETTYSPLRATVEALGGEVNYNGDTNEIEALYNGNRYSTSVSDTNIRIYNNTSFVPLRTMCESLGFGVGWNSGIIVISDISVTLSDEEAQRYKNMLQFTGYKDEFFTPRHVVNPYCTYTYDYMNSDIALLARVYPDLFDVYSIGQTTEGRELMSFTFGKGDKKIIMCGSMHAREYFATNFLMYMIDQYAYSYANNEVRDGYNVRQLLNDVSFIVVPMVNPDGINLVQNGIDSTKNSDNIKNMPIGSEGYRGWKANINGVDLNNNFDCMWYQRGEGPSYAGYSGPYAASEVETQLMQKLIDETEFSIFASFHTQGQVVYWMDPNCNQELIQRFKPHIDRLCNEIGFEEMPSDGTIGYSGYMTDYVRYYKAKMAMTIELCPYVGNYPYPEEDFDIAAWPVRNIGLILADIAKKI